MAGNFTSSIPDSRNDELAKLIPLSVIIVITNSLVIVLFCARKSLRSWANIPLLSLAVCDFVTGFVNIPLLIITMLTAIIKSPEALDYLRYLVFVLHSFTAASAVYHILVVTLEKYLAIVWPLKYRCVTKKRVLQVLLVVWLLSFSIAFVPFSWIKLSQEPIGTKFFLGHEIFCLIAVFLLPYSFMIYAFIEMFRTISGRARGRQQVPIKLRRNSRNGNLRNHRKACTIFAFMASTFLVCWLPWFVLTLLYNLNVKDLDSLIELFVLLRYVTSISNPLLYTFFKPDFRQALREFFVYKGTHSPFKSTFTWRNSTTSQRKTTCEGLLIQTDETATFVSAV